MPTRVTQKTSSLLDNIYTTLPYRNSSKGVLNSDHSDHYIVFTIQHGTTSTKAPTHRKMREFSEQNISKLKKKIKNTSWDEFYAIPLAQDALATSKRFPTEENKRAYKSARNIVISKLRNAERKHYDEHFDLYGNDNHKKWNVIK